MEIPSIRYAPTSDGVNIAYTQFGDGPLLVETPMLLFNVPPALPVEERTFYEQMAERRTLVSYDARGVGQSDPAPSSLSIETTVLDLEAVVDALGVPPSRSWAPATVSRRRLRTLRAGLSGQRIWCCSTGTCVVLRSRSSPPPWLHVA